MNIWLLVKINSDGKKILNINLKKSPLEKIKKENYANDDSVTVEEHIISLNQDIAYFGWLLDDIAKYTDEYLNSFMDLGYYHTLEEKEQRRNWAIKKLIEKRSEISRLAHIIERNDVSNSDNLRELMDNSRLRNQKVGLLTCCNSNCIHWEHTNNMEGICNVSNPKFNVDGLCISKDEREVKK